MAILMEYQGKMSSRAILAAQKYIKANVVSLAEEWAESFGLSPDDVEYYGDGSEGSFVATVEIRVPLKKIHMSEIDMRTYNNKTKTATKFEASKMVIDFKAVGICSVVRDEGKGNKLIYITWKDTKFTPKERVELVTNGVSVGVGVADTIDSLDDAKYPCYGDIS